MQEQQMKKMILESLEIEMDKVTLEYLEEGDKELLKNFTANELAKRFSVSRNLISHYLNQLFRDNKVIKIDTRPVYFFSKRLFCEKFQLADISTEYGCLHELGDEIRQTKPKISSFSQMIGADESLIYCIDQCKSAINYPLKGLPILLNGSTGTGKSMLARCMYDYAKEIGKIQNDAKFVTINCAEYANNPELLLTNLFGYKKGAFTDANIDHQGLISLANGGVLFLDEVHALKSECQEKIFLFMDKGIYHMVGDNETWYEANIHMIFATTEDPQVCLLKTMLRRIPIVVKLPNLKQRSLHEKKELIYHLLQKEAEQIEKHIRISKLAYQIMESIDYVGNVGELKNHIKASVAKAFLRQANEEYIDIHIYDFPNELLELHNKELVTSSFDDKTMIDVQQLENEKAHFKLYQFNYSLICAFNDFNNKENNFPNYAYSMHDKIEQYIDYLYYHDEENDSPNSKFIYNMLANIFQIIASKYQLEKVTNHEISILSRLIIDYLNHNNVRVEFSKLYQKEMKQCLDLIQQFYPLDHAVALDIVALIEDALHLRIGAIGQIDIFLFFHYFDRDMKQSAIPGIIIAHGYNIASSIADVANQLLNQRVFDAIDMPIESDFTMVVSRLKNYILQKEGAKEFIVMVDMGSLEDIYSYMESIDDIEIGIINNASTKLALSIGSMILEGCSITNILEEVSIRNQHRYKIVCNRKKHNCILTVCETGIGTAEKIASLIEKSMPERVEMKIIPYDYASLVSSGIAATIFSKYNVITVVGTKDPEINVPFISIEELLEQDNIERILYLFENYLDERQVEQFNENIIKYFSMDNLLNYLTILDTEKIMGSVQFIIREMQRGLQITFSNRVTMGLYVHIACLIERLIISKCITKYEKELEFIKNHQDFIQLVKGLFADIERTYNVEIPISEIAYIYDYIYYRPCISVNKNKESVQNFDSL